jgi:hypothetical protein
MLSRITVVTVSAWRWTSASLDAGGSATGDAPPFLLMAGRGRVACARRQRGARAIGAGRPCLLEVSTARVVCVSCVQSASRLPAMARWRARAAFVRARDYEDTTGATLSLSPEVNAVDIEELQKPQEVVLRHLGRALPATVCEPGQCLDSVAGGKDSLSVATLGQHAIHKDLHIAGLARIRLCARMSIVLAECTCACCASRVPCCSASSRWHSWPPEAPAPTCCGK